MTHHDALSHMTPYTRVGARALNTSYAKCVMCVMCVMVALAASCRAQPLQVRQVSSRQSRTARSGDQQRTPCEPRRRPCRAAGPDCMGARDRRQHARQVPHAYAGV